jgi:hypothetical protein
MADGRMKLGEAALGVGPPNLQMQLCSLQARRYMFPYLEMCQASYVPVNYGIRASGPVTALTARLIKAAETRSRFLFHGLRLGPFTYRSALNKIFLKATQWRATMKTIDPVGEREVLQILGMTGGGAGAKTEMITMGESALTVQIDIETLEIEGETDVTTMATTTIVLRKESEVIHAHHPLLLDQDNLEARLHILNAPKHPYLLKKKPSEIMAPLYPCGKNSTPALETFATRVFVVEISKNPPKKSLSTFLITVIPR